MPAASGAAKRKRMREQEAADSVGPRTLFEFGIQSSSRPSEDSSHHQSKSTVDLNALTESSSSALVNVQRGP
jgi:hypothetical protein